MSNKSVAMRPLFSIVKSFSSYPYGHTALDPGLIGYIGSVLSEEARLRQGQALPLTRFRRSILDEKRNSLGANEDEEGGDLENVFDADLGN